ncbi:MAG: hypothetical protein QXS19_06830, partial [Candidatus Methanomethylicia archaeon]
MDALKQKIINNIREIYDFEDLYASKIAQEEADTDNETKNENEEVTQEEANEEVTQEEETENDNEKESSIEKKSNYVKNKYGTNKRESIEEEKTVTKKSNYKNANLISILNDTFEKVDVLRDAINSLSKIGHGNPINFIINDPEFLYTANLDKIEKVALLDEIYEIGNTLSTAFSIAKTHLTKSAQQQNLQQTETNIINDILQLFQIAFSAADTTYILSRDLFNFWYFERMNIKNQKTSTAKIAADPEQPQTPEKAPK